MFSDARAGHVPRPRADRRRIAVGMLRLHRPRVLLLRALQYALQLRADEQRGQHSTRPAVGHRALPVTFPCLCVRFPSSANTIWSCSLSLSSLLSLFLSLSPFLFFILSLRIRWDERQIIGGWTRRQRGQHRTGRRSRLQAQGPGQSLAESERGTTQGRDQRA